MRHVWFFTATAVVLALAPRPSTAVTASVTPGDLPPVLANDNRRAAGRLEGGTLRLVLRAAAGLWRPEGERGPALAIEAFAESDGALQAPSPLIRVTEGTEIVADVRNDLDEPLRVHGLCARDGSPCAPIEVPVAESRQVRFKPGRAGTYHYWATTNRVPLAFRAALDTQLSGAFIVDAPGHAPGADRVLVITEWTNLTRAQLRELGNAEDPGTAFLALEPKFTFLINGLSWPATERLQYKLGEDVRWRVINLSTQLHPMHLHGFHFQVQSLGDGLRDEPFDAGATPHVVTQLLEPGRTMAIAWRPEKAGNWLFHCHISHHVAPERRLSGSTDAHAGHNRDHGALGGMAGMILGVTVTAPDGVPADVAGAPAIPARRLTLVMRTEPERYGAEPAYGFVLADAEGAARVETVPVPGPTLLLPRGEPVEIALVNLLPEATTIHWHGMELESYYDGVHGWSGAGTRVTPLIEPGESFTVRFTPPRAGTFMYHTHMHDERQLTSGMYGALIVLEPGEAFDPSLDHVIVMGRWGPGKGAPVVLNGAREPKIVLRSGSRHRLRFVNITPDDILTVSLATPRGPLTWRALAKDAAPVPPDASASRAATQTIAVGETYDFEYEAPLGRQAFWMDVRTPGGRWEVQARVTVK